MEEISDRYYVMKSIILTVIFMLMITVTFFIQKDEEAEGMYTTFAVSKLPVLYMQTPEGTLINPAYGYTKDVGEAYMFSGITPMDETRTLMISFYDYGAGIHDISYELRDIATGQLLENTAVDSKLVTTQSDYVNATLELKNMVELGKEYFLTVVLHTTGGQEVRYYERIYYQGGLNVDDMVNWCMQFNALTYNKENLSTISQWIEPDDTGDNTNFGLVNIHSTRAQIGWGTLTPRVEGNIVPVIWDISPTFAQISLGYNVVISTASDDQESYTVMDYYKLQLGRGEIFLMDYERRADQKFDAYEDLQTSGRIDFGVQSDLSMKVESMSDGKGNYNYFVMGGNLWCYDRGNNMFTNVFSFTASAEYSGRETSKEHEIRLISVEGNGNVYFSVMGYMNGGDHDGEVGISLFFYDYATNVVNERIYIPVNVPYRIACGNVADVSYVSDETYFIKVNQYLYSIDLVSGEYMMITDSLYDGTYAVNASGDRIAYHRNHEFEENPEIVVFDFTNHTERVITGKSYASGADTDYMKIIGYLEDDLVYGLIRPEDVLLGDGLTPVYPMYKVVILEDTSVVSKIYEESGIYVESAEIEGMRVTLNRVKKIYVDGASESTSVSDESSKKAEEKDTTKSLETSDGEEVVESTVAQDARDFIGYDTTSIDQIISRDENATDGSIFTQIVTSSLYEKQVYLNIPTSSGDLDEVEIRYSKAIQYENNREMELANDYVFPWQYMIYGKGLWQGKTGNLVRAISSAALKEGLVLDLNARYLWKYQYDTLRYPWDSANVTVDPMNYEYNLAGLNLDQALYYVSKGYVLAARMGENKFVYIYDYTADQILYYDPVLEQDVTLDREIAVRKFIEWDNLFLCLKK